MNQILTFDCYGTLLDTDPLYRLIADTADSLGLQPERAVGVYCAYEDRLMYGEDFVPYPLLLRNILSYCDMELNTAAFSPLHARLMKVHEQFEPFPDVLPAIRQLKDRGYELCIMSNTTRQLMDGHLSRLGGLFDCALTAEDTRCYKPNLKFFESAETCFGLRGKDYCHIARGYWWDIVPAHKMGWQKIWVNRSHLSRGRAEESPYLTISSLSELPQLQ